ncbi:hypothetical protein [Luteolibacter marinus]|uniref:hypothetical protein n=1 Tax=Luteolibacter marinus TaxID=2776705 RepID=UPI001866049E|nr:hypothetical protein [Luteolibacter marinus]
MLNDHHAEDPLVEALMKPLGHKPAYEFIALQMTGHARQQLPHGFDSACQETADHLRSKHCPGRWKSRSIRLLTLFALVTGIAYFLPGRPLQELRLLLMAQEHQLPQILTNTLRGDERVRRERILSRIPASDARILFGDPDAESPDLKWQALAEEEPNDPGRYADHALHVLATTLQLPPDFTEHAERIDPGNGYYHFVQGITELERASRYLALANSAMDQALRASRLEDPTRITWQERLELLPDEELWADIKVNARFLGEDAPGRSTNMAWQIVLLQLAEEAQSSGDSTATAKYTTLWITTLAHGLKHARTAKDLLEMATMTHLVVSSTPVGRSNPLLATPAFKDTSALAERCDRQATHMVGGLPPESYFATKASVIGNRSRVTADLTRPGIAAEWAMHERLIGWGGVLLATLLFAIYLMVRNAHRGQSRLVDRIGQILHPADHALLLAVPLGLPFGLYLAATRWPGHEWSQTPLSQPQDPRFGLLAILQFSCLIAVPLLALETARWRLARRGSALGMAGRGIHLGMIPLAMVLGSLVGAAIFSRIDPPLLGQRLPMLGIAGGAAAGFLWLIALVVWHFAAPAESFTERLVRLRAIRWPMLLGMFIITGGMFAVRCHEVQLVKLNRYEKSPRTHGGHLTLADQQFFEEWQPLLLEAILRVEREMPNSP